MKVKPRVVVLGGGFAGLEAAFHLRHLLGDRIGLTIVNEHDYFVFKPNMIYIPFGESPEKFKVPIGPAARRKQIDFIVGRALDIDHVHKTVTTSDGLVLAFDYLVVATGASMRPEEIPGLGEHSLTPWTPREMVRMRHGLERLVDDARSGERQKLLFLVPPNNMWSSPLYELVLMTDTWLTEQGARGNVDITWSTYEQGYVQAFGPRMDEVVASEFEQRGIRGHKGVVVASVEAGAVRYQGSESLHYDLLVSFPPHVPKETFAGLPVDSRGFVAADPESRRVSGSDSIFAIGDAADYPIKQAYLALLQGDTAAAHIASEISGQPVPPEAKFEPTSVCILEELDKAAFAQVPLLLTGDEAVPVVVETDDEARYRVGVSPLWRAGKKFVGLYLPWRFGSGEPFNAGFTSGAMDIGLKVASKLMAR
jgi:sulfide:quinone oxidoreductase